MVMQQAQQLIAHTHTHTYPDEVQHIAKRDIVVKEGVGPNNELSKNAVECSALFQTRQFNGQQECFGELSSSPHTCSSSWARMSSANRRSVSSASFKACTTWRSAHEEFSNKKKCPNQPTHRSHCSHVFTRSSSCSSWRWAVTTSMYLLANR